MKMKIKTFKILGAIILTLMAGSMVRSQNRDDAVQTKILAGQYLERKEAKLKETDEPRLRFWILYYLTPAAFDAGEIKKAGDYAREFLEIGKKVESQPGFGPGMKADTIHVGNTVLGRIALAEGNTEEAKQRLLAAGDVTNVSPTLKSFGPNMRLAKELFEKGETETVSKYLDLCGVFWDSDKGRTAKWKKSIENGEKPDFKGQVTTILDSWRGDYQ